MDSESLEKTVIVVGGFDGNFTSSVEVLNDQMWTWEFGPELPFGIEEAALVEDQSGLY